MGKNVQVISTDNFRRQRGFTLMELMVVVVIIGILASIVLPKLLGNKEPANALLLRNTAESATVAWGMINQECGTPTVISTTHPVLASGKTVEDVIFVGEDAVGADYKVCYRKARVIAMAKVSQPGASAGTYNVGGFQVAMAGGGTSPVKFTIKATPESLALEIAQVFAPNMEALAASDSSSKVLQYTAATGGVRDVTFLQRIS